MKAQPVSFSAMAFLKISAAVLFCFLMTEMLCPYWFLALLLSANILQCMGLIALKYSTRAMKTSFLPLRLGQWNTVVQFAYIALLLSDAPVNTVTRNFGYLFLASFQVVVFFKYLFRFRQLLIRVFDPTPLPTLSKTAT